MMKSHSLVIVFTLFDALVGNKYLDLFGLDYRIEAPKAIHFEGALEQLPTVSALENIPDLILLNDLEKLPASFLRFLDYHRNRINIVYPITHTGSRPALQARNLQLLKEHLGDNLHPHPLSQHSSCGVIVERIVAMAHGFQTRDHQYYTRALQSIMAEFAPV